MASGGFLGSLGLLVLLCSVDFSIQQAQDKSAAWPGAARSQDKSAQAAANAIAQSHLVGHPAPITTPSYDPVTCEYAEQVINYRDWNDVCHVCVCVTQYDGTLKPVCGSCADCPPIPPPSPPPPITTPAPPTPPPLPTCDPFPTNQVFTNPMDPCQICICEQPNPYVVPRIQCKPNPECVIPTVRPTVPPTPPPPNPWICEHYPPNVFFPHPQYICMLCRCEKWGPGPAQLECSPDPACDPTMRPVPIPTTSVAPPTPRPPPPKPHVDPLPGPGPHPSCSPFEPDQIFQHPWDPCLACVCTELNYGGITNVQVNCFTKAECCIIPPGPEPSTPYPIIRPPPPNRGQIGHVGSIANANANANVVTGGGSSMVIPGSPSNSLAQADAAAEAAAQAQAAAQAVQANYVNQYPYIQPNQGAAAQAAAQAQAQANQALAQALSEANAGVGSGPIPSGYYNPNNNAPGGYANANANALVNSLYQQPSPYYYPGSMGGSQAQAGSNAQTGWGSAQSNAEAQAQGDAQAQAEAQAQSNSGYGANGWNPAQDALAQAQANAQSALYAAPQAPLNPYGFGGLGSSNAQAQADAEAEAGRGSASAQAAASALAQELASQAQAQAQASANSNRGAEASAQAQASAGASLLKSGDSDTPDVEVQY